jgi:hypothetical protein
MFVEGQIISFVGQLYPIGDPCATPRTSNADKTLDDRRAGDAQRCGSVREVSTEQIAVLTEHTE